MAHKPLPIKQALTLGLLSIENQIEEMPRNSENYFDFVGAAQTLRIVLPRIPGPKPEPTKQEIIKRAHKLRRDGSTWSSIAKSVGVTRMTLRKWMAEDA